MNRETVILVGVAAVIVAIFGAVFVIGLQPPSPERAGGVTAPLDVDIPPETIVEIRDDPPKPRYSDDPLAPDRPEVPPNEVLDPPDPSPGDVTEPPAENPEDCVSMELVPSRSNVTAGEPFTVVLNERARTPEYKGNVTNFLLISPAASKDVVVQVPLQHGERPFRNIEVNMSDRDGYTYGALLDLSPDGETLLGYTWTPRQGAEWWLPIDISILEPGEYTVSVVAYDAETCVRVAEDVAVTIEVKEKAAVAEGPFFTGVTANGLNASMETDTTYHFDIGADATPRYLELLNDSLVREPGGPSCHLNENGTVFSWRLDLEGANASDLLYSHYMRYYFVGDPGAGGPWAMTPEPIDGGVRLDLGAAPMAHSYSAYGMGQQYYDCNTTFDDAERWNASMGCAIHFTTPGTYRGELYLVGPDNETASEKLEVTITVTAKAEPPPEETPPEETLPSPEPVTPDEPNETPTPIQPPAPESPEEPTGPANNTTPPPVPSTQDPNSTS